MLRVLILGSCVTRDAFDPKLMQYDVKIVNYFARTSLARLAYPMICVREDAFDLKSSFQRKVLAHALSGDFLEHIKTADFDYLVLDMVDDRFGLVRLDVDDIYVTFSDELRNAKFIKAKNKVKILANTELYKKLWETGLKELLKYVPSHKIIVNNVQWATHTNTGESLSTPERIAFCTDVVNSLYSIASKYIPSRNFINYPVDIFVGNEKHKWGRSPFHYVDDVYRYFNKRLLDIFIN